MLDTRNPSLNRDSRAQSSFRDPSGRLLTIDGRIIRLINQSGLPDLAAFLDSRSARHLVEEGQVVRTDFLGIDSIEGLLNDPRLHDLHLETEGSVLVEHERIPFQSFPYEWPPEMLHAAGRLTLDLAQTLLKDGLSLKDATPYNVLFRGPNAVFVDVLSFEKRDPGDPIWLPYAQFVRTFLLPLLANMTLAFPWTSFC